MVQEAKSNRVEDAYNCLKDEILNGRIAPGFQATEPEVAVRLGISRTPVREALVRLQSEGLVELIPRRGVRILPLSTNDMREIYELFNLLEPEAAAGLARDPDNSEILFALEQSTKQMEVALEEGNLDAWAKADDAFHRRILAAMGNRRLSAFVNNLLDQAHRARMVTLRLREPPWRSTAEHREILAAISVGDADAVRSIYRKHRERAASELLEVLERCQLTNL